MKKRLARIERIKGFKNGTMGRMLTIYQSFGLRQKAKQEGMYPYLRGELPSYRILDVLVKGGVLGNISQEEQRELLCLLPALTNSIRVEELDCPTERLTTLCSSLSIGKRIKSLWEKNYYSPLGHHLDRENTPMFLGYPYGVTLAVMASHGLTAEKALRFRLSLSLESTVLMSTDNAFLLMEMGLNPFEPLKIPSLIQLKYSVVFHVLRAYQDKEGREKIIKKLYEDHQIFPHVFSRSANCVVCLLFSLQDSITYRRDKRTMDRWYCPFDKRREDDCRTLRGVAEHLHITCDGCSSLCRHLKKMGIEKNEPEKRQYFSFDTLDIYQLSYPKKSADCFSQSDDEPEGLQDSLMDISPSQERVVSLQKRGDDPLSEEFDIVPAKRQRIQNVKEPAIPVCSLTEGLHFLKLNRPHLQREFVLELSA